MEDKQNIEKVLNSLYDASILQLKNCEKIRNQQAELVGFIRGALINLQLEKTNEQCKILIE